MLLGTHRFIGVVSFFILSFIAGSTLAQAQGGFIDSATSAGVRPRLSAGEVQSFMPQRGAFTFPSPYGTAGARLTNSSDCAGSDCVIPVGYSYWSNINNHVGSDTMLVFVGMERTKGGGGPTLFSFNKKSGETRNLGPMFDSNQSFSWATGEGWYFSATRPTSLYMNDGPRIMRYDVMSKQMETVYDVRTQLGSDKIIWQMHSSNDDRVHSATVRDNSTYQSLGCVAYNEASREMTYVASKGDYDECQIDKSGRWLVVKENVDGRHGEDNRIIDLETGVEQVFLDEDGAAGHSDVGYGYLVAEDNMAPQPGAVRVWKFGQDMKAPGQGTLVYQLAPGMWDGGLGHIAHSNAQPGAIDQQMVCSSNAWRQNLPRLNEIVCYRLDGSLNALVVAPNMVDLDASGGGGEDYMKRPKGNLDVTGEYFVWTSNMGGNRTDAFIVRIPTSKLGVSPASPTPAPTPAPGPSPAPQPSPQPTPTPTPAPAPAPAPSPSPAPSTGAAGWMSLINVSVNGNSIVKTGGCSGCPDGSAVSEQQIQGNGALQFGAAEAGTLRFVGLSSGGIGTGPADLTFALRLQSGVAEVRESGAYRSEIGFGSGDTFTIAVSNGSVTYAKNGSVFYTSGSQASYGVRVHAVFFDASAAIRDVVMSGGAGNASAEPAVAPAAAPVVVTAVRIAKPRPAGSVPVRRKR